MRQLHELHHGLQLAEWKRTTWLAAQIRSSHQRQPIRYDDLNPYLAEARQLGLLPAPRPRPFYLAPMPLLLGLVDPERRW